MGLLFKGVRGRRSSVVMEVGGVRSEKVRRGGPLKCGPEGCLTWGALGGEIRQEQGGDSQPVPS